MASSVISKQTILNKVWKRFVTEMAPLSIGEYGCMYRGPRGTECAVGCLLTDSECKGWDDFSNSTSISDIFAYNIDAIPVRFRVHKNFLIAIQSAHDDTWSWSDSRENRIKSLKDIARRWKLKVPKHD